MWRWLAAFFDLLDPPSEAMRLVQARPLLDHEAYYQRFYRDSGIPQQVVARIRDVFAAQLRERWLRVWPDDELGPLEPDVDFWEMALELEEVFDIKIPEESAERLNTLDAFIRCIADLVADR